MLDLLNTKFERGFDLPKLVPTGGDNSPPQFALAEEWRYRVHEGCYIILPKGSLINGASVPRMFWFLIPPHGDLLIPSIVHDFSYVKNKVLVEVGGRQHWVFGKDRAYWDLLFLKISQTVTPWSWKGGVAYWALVFFGGRAWAKYRSLDNK